MVAPEPSQRGRSPDSSASPLPPGRIAIIASRYNVTICDNLVDGAVRTLTAAGVESKNQWLIRVPGAWELGWAAATALRRSDTIAVICLGVVIRGETTHDQHINASLSTALMGLSVESGCPVGFGLLTCNTLDQAVQRSGGSVGNKGEEAADAVVELLRMTSRLR